MDNTDPTRPTPPPVPTMAPVAAPPAALVVPGGWQIEGLPDIVRRAGPQAAERTVEFFTAQIRNPHTRAAYAAAVTRFFTWCDAREFAQISPIAVATYIEEMHGRDRAPTIKQHLAAIRRLFDWLVTGQVMPTNPATSVRGPTHVVRTGKTPVLQPAEARRLLDTIDTSTLRGLRDRALRAVMVYSFCARLGRRRDARRGLLPLCEAIRDYDFPAVTYDFTEEKHLHHDSMLAVEQYIGTLLRSKDVSVVKDGLSNVLYWGYARQPRRRDFRVSDFRKTIPDPEREHKLDQFAQLMRSGRADLLIDYRLKAADSRTD